MKSKDIVIFGLFGIAAYLFVKQQGQNNDTGVPKPTLPEQVLATTDPKALPSRFVRAASPYNKNTIHMSA